MKPKTGAHRKSIAYAYPTSTHAEALGQKHGAFYLAQETMREDGTWSPAEPWPGSEGEACQTSTGAVALIKLYHEIDAWTSPYCMLNRLSP
jgi:hypothetical protein